MTGGHQIVNGVGTGVKSPWFEEAEMARHFITKVADYMYNEYGLSIVTDKDYWSLAHVVQWLKRQVTQEDIVIDVHFNAFHKPEANGTEVFVPHDSTTKERHIAKKLLDCIVKTLGTKSRGIKPEGASQHARLAMLSQPYKAQNVLIEICFITNTGDVDKFLWNFDDLVKNMGDTINQLYNEN